MPQTNGSLTSGHSSSANSSSSEASEAKQSLSKKENIICTEVFDENSSPTKDEVIEYARKIGIDVEKEPELLYLAREGLLKELPAQWKPCLDDTIGDYYYFNTDSGETQWAHPLDEIYRQKVIVARESGKNASTSVVTEGSPAETMDKPKLGPLPPLGGGSSKGAGSLKGLPPLKKPPSIGALGSSLSSSPKSSPSRIVRSSPNKESPSKLTTKDKTDSPMKVQSEKGLSLKLGGANFLKPQAKELLTDDDEDDDNLTSEPPKIVSSEPTKVRSILKGSSSPLTKKSANFSQDQVEPKKNLRAAMVARDESRRIQFDIQAEKKALVMDDEPTETSSESVAIDDINVKKDFMEKHSLFDPAELLATSIENTSEVSNDDEDSEKNSAKPSPVKSIPEKSQEKPKPEPKFVKSTSSDISEEISRNENVIRRPNLQSGITKAARPMSARHSSSPKKEMIKSTSSDISEDISRNENITRRPPGTVPKTARPMSARNLSSVLQKEPELKKSLTLSSSSSEDEKVDEFLQNVKFKEETVSTVQNKKKEMEAEKFNFAKIEANLRAEHEAEMRGLTREMEKEKLESAKEKMRQEEILKEMFEKDLENLKLQLEKEFACEKTQMLRDFEEKLTHEKHLLKVQFEKDFKIREDKLQQEMEALKQEFQTKKESLENDLKSQFSQDIANLRKELEEAKKIQISAQQQNSHYKNSEPPEPQKSKKKDKNRSSKNRAFLREIEDLEEDIQELRSQVKIGSTLVYEDSDSENQDFYMRKPSPAMQLQPQPYGLPQQPDLGRSLETLQQRVEALERGLTPFTVPYPTFTTYPQPQQAQTMMNGFQYSPNTSPLANGIQIQVPNVEVPQQTRVMVNGWTVDEQIYKSKLWLKQRNQQMLHRSSK